MVLQELILEREIQQKYSKWDDLHQQKDLSKVIFSSDSKCVRAHPESSFITVFTPSGHSKGIHYWEVKVTKGRVIYSYMIGVGEKNNIRSGLHSHGFCYRSEVLSLVKETNLLRLTGLSMERVMEQEML
eukprot:TRINITY_DN982_c0_g1_i1.p1 TRINITY_DN982_c0_g1~~TRINITY_DN982_c0_g1_i1.p1  ORF type:complete len:129 (-),score=13.81 TRINITY_DN982_c0_g1_i1:347-733(-)